MTDRAKKKHALRKGCAFPDDVHGEHDHDACEDVIGAIEQDLAELERLEKRADAVRRIKASLTGGEA